MAKSPGSKIKIPQSVSSTIMNARSTIRDSNSSESEIQDAITSLNSITELLNAQRSQGFSDTRKSQTVDAQVANLIEEANALLVDEDDDGDAEEPFSASISQNHYDITVDATPDTNRLTLVANEIAERLADYADEEDVSAEYTIVISEGSAEKASSSGYQVTLVLTDKSTAWSAFKILAVHLVRIFDEMDSDYDGDVDEFLMDI